MQEDQAPASDAAEGRSHDGYAECSSATNGNDNNPDIEPRTVRVSDLPLMRRQHVRCLSTQGRADLPSVRARDGATRTRQPSVWVPARRPPDAPGMSDEHAGMICSSSPRAGA